MWSNTALTVNYTHHKYHIHTSLVNYCMAVTTPDPSWKVGLARLCVFEGRAASLCSVLMPLSVPRVVQILAGRGHIELERELHKVYRMFLEGQASLVKLKGLSPRLTTVTFTLLNSLQTRQQSQLSPTLPLCLCVSAISVSCSSLSRT